MLSISSLIILLPLAASMGEKIHFKTYDVEKSTQIFVICSYGDNTTGRYFDIYRNGRPCITAAFGACARVVNSGCQCAEEMEINEVRFLIDSPINGYAMLTCRVLSGISKEKTINATSEKLDEKKLQRSDTLLANGKIQELSETEPDEKKLRRSDTLVANGKIQYLSETEIFQHNQARQKWRDQDDFDEHENNRGDQLGPGPIIGFVAVFGLVCAAMDIGF